MEEEKAEDVAVEEEKVVEEEVEGRMREKRKEGEVMVEEEADGEQAKGVKEEQVVEEEVKEEEEQDSSSLCQSSEMFICHWQQLNIFLPPFHFSPSLSSPRCFSPFLLLLLRGSLKSRQPKSQTAANYLRTEAFLT